MHAPLFMAALCVACQLTHRRLAFVHQLWNDRAEVFCSPRGSDGSSLTCRETVDKHLPPATAPHTMCDGTNIAFNFEILRKAKCQKHRPGYNCKGDAYWWSYPSGALTVSGPQLSMQGAIGALL